MRMIHISIHGVMLAALEKEKMGVSGAKWAVGMCACAWVLSAHAENQQSTGEHSLPEVKVEATHLKQRVYSREKMDATPQSNRDLAGLIADHPALRPISNEDGAANKGSLAPESFSIHGESPHQNQFQIDGMSATNVINPHETDPGSTAKINRVVGFSQAYNLDTDLLEAVEVYDNRVPVEFSSFTGGVVDAKIKTPQGTGKWTVKRSFNSASLTKQQVSESLREKWEEGVGGYSSDWEKNFSTLTGDIALNDSTNALLSFSRRQSIITRLQSIQDPDASEWSKATLINQTVKEDDAVDNVFAKVHTKIGEAQASALLKYADRREALVNKGTTAHGLDWTNRQKSYGFSGEYLQPLASGLLSVKAGVDYMNALREDDEYGLITETDLPGGTYFYGGQGTEALEQTQYSAKLRHDWLPLQWGESAHQFYAGVEVQNTRAAFVRAKDTEHETYKRRVNADGTSERYLNQLNRYAAGAVTTQHNSVSAYASHQVHWHDWELRSAVRWDYNDFLKHSNFSPRLGLDWDIWGDKSAQIGVGWARYYGMDMLGYSLEAGKSQLLTYVVQGGVVTNKPGAVTQDAYSGLKTPRSDEWALAYRQQLGPKLQAKLEYVRRAGRDNITRSTISGVQTYANGGSSRSETVMLGLQTTQAVRWAGASWFGGVDVSWLDTQRNYQNTSGWAAYAGDDDDIITVDGVQMKRKDKPVSEFSLPRRFAMSWNAHWAKAGVKWGNRLNWNASRTGLALTVAGTGSTKETYHTKKLPSYWTWDSSVQWSPSQLKGVRLSLEVLNVLNQIRPISVVASSAGSARMQTGREIWINAAYEF